MRQLKIETRITNRSRQLEKYFTEISSIKKSSSEDELSKRLQKKEQAAIDELVKTNLKFVISVAKQYAADHTVLEDLISQGNLGLIEAAHKYDPTTGFKFISYAVWFIRKEILLYFGKLHHTITPPIKVHQDLRRIKRIEDRLEMQLERPPTLDEVAVELAATGEAIRADRIDFLKKQDTFTVALDTKQTDEDVSLIDVVPVTDDLLTAFESRNEFLVKELLAALTQKERELVIAVLGLDGNSPMKIVTIGEQREVTGSALSSAYRMAVKKMKRKYNELIRMNEDDI